MLPQEFLQRIHLQLGEEYEAFLQSYERPRAVGLRLNPLKGEAPPLPFALEPVPWAKDGYYYQSGERPGLHPWHEAGVYYLQEPSAMAPAPLLAVQPGERVLDLCAAPGGKSTQLAAFMQGRGLLVCNEYSPKRAKILSQNIERMGIANALVLNETPAALAVRFPGYFDKILVDAPCSGEGMFRKEEAALTDWSEETVALCAARQLDILRCAGKMLRPGGRLVYSTCTFAPEENEGVIAAFLALHPDFSVEQAYAPWFAPGRPDWVAGGRAELANTFRLWPHRLRGEGHFAAVLRREGAQFCAAPEEPASALPPDYVALPTLPQGKAISFGQEIFWAPTQLPRLRGLRVLRPGLALGQALKGRFEPAHALALWAKDAPQNVNYAADSEEIAKYLHGEALPGQQKGWTLVQVDGFSIGWAKGANGLLKNHYPKGLRRIMTTSVADL